MVEQVKKTAVWVLGLETDPMENIAAPDGQVQTPPRTVHEGYIAVVQS